MWFFQRNQNGLNLERWPFVQQESGEEEWDDPCVGGALQCGNDDVFGYPHGNCGRIQNGNDGGILNVHGDGEMIPNGNDF